jgi:hypothetical protein
MTNNSTEWNGGLEGGEEVNDQNGDYIRRRDNAAKEQDGPYKVVLVDQFQGHCEDGYGDYKAYPTFADAVEVARAITESAIRECGLEEGWLGMGDAGLVYDVHHRLVWSGVIEYSNRIPPLPDPDGINRAVIFATLAHEGQFRKGTQIPYVTHPISTGMILARAGCSDDLIIAGILHDCIEDTDVTFEQLADEFDFKVATIVRDCSEKDKKATWIQRKKQTIRHLKTVSDDACLVSCADKTHNLLSVIQDFRGIGDALWDRFNATKEAQLWYYKSLGGVFSARGKQHQIYKEFLNLLAIFLALVDH